MISELVANFTERQITSVATNCNLDLNKVRGAVNNANRILQVVQGHSPFKDLVNRFENELIIATEKGEPAAVMSEYGFKKVLSIDEYASYFNDIDPLSQHKTWGSKQAFDMTATHPRFNVFSEEVQAAFVVSDPVDWGRDIQERKMEELAKHREEQERKMEEMRVEHERRMMEMFQAITARLPTDAPPPPPSSL